MRVRRKCQNSRLSRQKTFGCAVERATSKCFGNPAHWRGLWVIAYTGNPIPITFLLASSRDLLLLTNPLLLPGKPPTPLLRSMNSIMRVRTRSQSSLSSQNRRGKRNLTSKGLVEELPTVRVIIGAKGRGSAGANDSFRAYGLLGIGLRFVVEPLLSACTPSWRSTWKAFVSTFPLAAGPPARVGVDSKKMIGEIL